jgi:hypothetical protein
VREDLQQIVMYYHGQSEGRQFTRAALSEDGIHFEGREEDLGRAYFRVIEHEGFHYAMSMPGYLFRSRDGMTNFKAGPQLFTSNMRHSGLLIREGRLYVFFTNRGDEPERIMLSTIELTDDWSEWTASEPIEVLRPEMDYEGADLPLEASKGGTSMSGFTNSEIQPSIRKVIRPIYSIPLQVRAASLSLKLISISLN